MVCLTWKVETPASLEVSDFHSGAWMASLCVDGMICAIIAQIDVPQFQPHQATTIHTQGRTP
jgi:hypothetical protein